MPLLNLTGLHFLAEAVIIHRRKGPKEAAGHGLIPSTAFISTNFGMVNKSREDSSSSSDYFLDYISNYFTFMTLKGKNRDLRAFLTF